MEVVEIKTSNGRDAILTLECEHCGHKGEDKHAYLDEFYMNSVVPSILCANCGVNSDGTTEKKPHVNGSTTV